MQEKEQKESMGRHSKIKNYRYERMNFKGNSTWL